MKYTKELKQKNRKTAEDIKKARQYYEKFKKQKEFFEKKYENVSLSFNKRKLQLINWALGEFYARELTK